MRSFKHYSISKGDWHFIFETDIFIYKSRFWWQKTNSNGEMIKYMLMYFAHDTLIRCSYMTFLVCSYSAVRKTTFKASDQYTLMHCLISGFASLMQLYVSFLHHIAFLCHTETFCGEPKKAYVANVYEHRFPLFMSVLIYHKLSHCAPNDWQPDTLVCHLLAFL